jgi:hypothetical protein
LARASSPTCSPRAASSAWSWPICTRPRARPSSPCRWST